MIIRNNVVKTEDLKSKAGFTVSSDFADRDEIKKYVVTGKYAAVMHKGSYSNHHKVYTWLYTEWGVDKSIDMSKPVVEEYLNNPNQVSSGEELLTMICVPLKD